MIKLKNETEKRIRNLTLAQLDVFQSLINNEKPTVSSKEVLKGCKRKKTTRRSMASLASITRGDSPLVRKVGKISNHGGFLWKFNSDDWDIEEVTSVAMEMIEELKEGGFFK